MQLPIVLFAAAALVTVSALPESNPIITAAPEVKDVSASADHASPACSTDCWASYVECHHTLTFVYLCYTPPPCGTQTSPDPYHCPPPKTTADAASSKPSSFTTSTVSSKPAAAT
ncbi:hypothetical protein F5B22DRAFT_600620 [Xylaria bambusicola]|uniref:uncharacterized protein n=1 Tax=Xylaria bambusicola TaxID=326684 RepID=UPI0020084718|nr:uncharacterized protein F5B22DRAFT_600620 [Xylaria bambusicola]KAI0518275.1 hypothetical protein F5B22DRAFT_600620 [Xylaria bambusicola]